MEKDSAARVACDASAPSGVNWTPLPRGGARELRQGDVIGVGRSLLNFYET